MPAMRDRRYLAAGKLRRLIWAPADLRSESVVTLFAHVSGLSALLDFRPRAATIGGLPALIGVRLPTVLSVAIDLSVSPGVDVVRTVRITAAVA